jgi:hypothetical protein
MFDLVQIKGGFSLANALFRRTPDFIGATFNEAPRLDNASIERCSWGVPDNPVLRWLRNRLLFWAADRDDHARFRKLRAMANQSKDHENEVRFNAHEIACRRFWVDRPIGSGMGRFWVGWLFEKLSNCGQSLIRPFLAWSVTVLVCAMFYLSTWSGRVASELAVLSTTSASQDAQGLLHHGMALPITVFKWVGGTTAGTSCHWSYEEARTLTQMNDGKVIREIRFQETTALAEAFVLSFRNALILDRSDVSRRMYGCLYGVQDKGGQDYPTVPPQVTALSTFQSFLSAIFIFSFGLGLRNMFRIK